MIVSFGIMSKIRVNKPWIRACKKSIWASCTLTGSFSVGCPVTPPPTLVASLVSGKVALDKWGITSLPFYS